MNSQKQLDFLIQYLVDERDEIIDIPNNQKEKRNLFRALMNIRLPKNISNQFLEVQDKFLTDEMLNKNLTSPGDIEDVSGKLMLWQGDIVTLKVDAIVNAANSKLLGCFIPLHNCIDNVIHSAAGVQLRQECDRIMRNQGKDEKVGRAKITDAYNLPSKHVIHTVGPAIPQGLKPSQSDCEALTSCYNSCLQMASEHNLESLAFCCISTGVFNFPKQMAAEIAVKTVKKYLDSNKTSLQHVIFNVFDDESYAIYKKLIF